jgi:hypothetical protein
VPAARHVAERGDAAIRQTGMFRDVSIAVFERIAREVLGRPW